MILAFTLRSMIEKACPRKHASTNRAPDIVLNQENQCGFCHTARSHQALYNLANDRVKMTEMLKGSAKAVRIQINIVWL